MPIIYASDYATLQDAFDALGNDATLFVEAGEYELDDTLHIGDGTTTTRSTKHNSLTIIWEGGAPHETSLVNPLFSGIARSGVLLKRTGASTGPVVQINGPIHGIRSIGNFTCLCEGIAAKGVYALSMSHSQFDAICVDSATAVGVDLYVQEKTIIDGNENGIGTSVNSFEEIVVLCNDQPGSVCLKLDGYKFVDEEMRTGKNVTHNRFGTVKLGIDGDSGVGLYLGFCDFNRIDVLVNVVYDPRTGAPAGIHLEGTSTPFASPTMNFIAQAAVGQNVGITVDLGPMNDQHPGQNYIYAYSKNDGALHISEAAAPYIGATIVQKDQPVIHAGLAGAVTYQERDASADRGPLLTLDRFSASPAVGDAIGGIRITGRNNADGFAVYGDFYGYIVDPSSGSEDGRWICQTMFAGTLTATMQLGPGVAFGSPTGAVPTTPGHVNAIQYQINGNKVVADRKSGWSPATGTAARTTFATYNAPNISNPPTEAEVQALADHVEVLSRRLKALIDDLHATAGHGLIGT